ncbi:UDP-glucose--hexose-1-phosphate uridylyltransferase [Schleiferilactobacillus shenzhenensis]|nr:UDP-glucose--hexose-1-phosphate uridylyltransferase [Schleiferilactobacillus shenzhenensis]
MAKTALVAAFVKAIIAANPEYEAVDDVYLSNRILALVGDDALHLTTETTNVIDLKDELVAHAVKTGEIDDSQPDRDILGDQLMDLYTPTPGLVNREFWKRYEESPEAATNYFHSLSENNDYIQTRRIAKNIRYLTPTDYGKLEITINLSKPEKDPKAIAAAAKQKNNTNYPQCQLCLQNEGYKGRLDYPARSNHRIIRFDINGHHWGFQYSPYAYFNEHSIFLDTIHEPMHITEETFVNLLHIVTVWPHYFVGSNADLPIVGGSMLSHEHYQGGRHTFPMTVAKLDSTFTWPAHPNVTAGIVHWPMSCIRLTAADTTDLVAAAEEIRAAWQEYSDDALDIRAYTDGTRHHTVTPIASRTATGDYQLDLVLRDNQTSAQYPDGIFHPHQDVQHIKKENIGLIEVMGLAVLPARLKDELAEVEKFLLGQDNAMKEYHRPWAEQLAKDNAGRISASNVEDIVRQAVGHVFLRVLMDAGVYKRDAAGQAGFQRFISSVTGQ